MSEQEYTIRRDAVRAYCIWCCGDSKPEVRKCNNKKCPLWRYRMGTEICDLNETLGAGARVPRGQAIKDRCLDCSAGNRKEVKNCPHTDCPLHKYRL